MHAAPTSWNAVSRLSPTVGPSIDSGNRIDGLSRNGFGATQSRLTTPSMTYLIVAWALNTKRCCARHWASYLSTSGSRSSSSTG